MQSNRDYRADVGPPDLFDVIGALQFTIMTSHGLREHHKLLDIGCGCLRGGKLFIPYLKKGNYYGIEPNEQLLHIGIDEELSQGMIDFKLPTFNTSPNFDIHAFGIDFDFILAQSIFSHADQSQIKRCLQQVSKHLKPYGKFIFTFFAGSTNYSGTGWTRMPSAVYQYPWLAQQAQAVGLTTQKLNGFHPAGQTWVLTTHKE